jgi:dihydrolipoamide dehydrogenase
MKTIAVLGGGSAGFTAARTASENGARVLFFMGDNADHGSLCINAGCMPSKALFEPIDAMHHARQHGWLEVRPKQPDEYLAQITRWKDGEIEKFRVYREEEIQTLASETVSIIRSNASFASDHTVMSEGKRYPFDAAIIATGRCRAAENQRAGSGVGRGVDERRDLAQRPYPQSLAVIGGGAIGPSFHFVMRGLALP